MVKGALGVLGASALLAIGCAQAFALDPVPSVPVPTVSVPAVPLPVPTVSVPVVTNPVPTVTDATPSVPSSPLPGSSTSSGSSGSSSGTGGSSGSSSGTGGGSGSSAGTGGSSGSSAGTGGSTSGSSAGTSGSTSGSSAGTGGSSGSSAGTGGSSGSSAGTGGSTSGSSSARPGAKGHSGTVRRFESRPPKFRSRGKGRRGTALVVWLSTDSLVAFSIVQIAPNCRGVGGFMRAGDQGRNRFSFSGRIDGRALSAGTYRIRAAAVQGQGVTSIRRETVVVVAPGQSMRSARAQKSTCGPGEEAAEDRSEMAPLADVGLPGTGGSRVGAGSPWAHSEASGGQASGGNGAAVAPESVAPPADFLLQPTAPNLAIASNVDTGWSPLPAGWSPLALSTAGAMFIVLLVIAGRGLAERYRGRDARWR
jgi:hypothetical protein